MKPVFHHPFSYPYWFSIFNQFYQSIQHSSWYGWLVLGFWFSLFWGASMVCSDWLIPSWFSHPPLIH